MGAGGPNLGLESHRLELFLVELQRGRYVLVVLLVRADARNAEELNQLVDVTLLVALDVVERGAQIHRGSRRAALRNGSVIQNGVLRAMLGAQGPKFNCPNFMGGNPQSPFF